MALYCHICGETQKRQLKLSNIPKISRVSIALLLLGLVLGAAIPLIWFSQAAVSPATPQSSPPSSDILVFRLDDISDSYKSSIMPFLTFALNNNIKLTLAVIVGDLNDKDIVNVVESGVQKGIFEVAVHGWHHEDLTAPGTNVIDILQRSITKLHTLFPGANVTTVITPYQAVNDHVLDAGHASGLTFVSGDLFYGEPFDRADGMRYRPATVGTAWIDYAAGAWYQVDLPTIKSDIALAMQAYGHAIVLMHPQQYETAGNFDQTKLNELEQLMEWAQPRMTLLRIQDLNSVMLGPITIRVNLFATGALRAIVLAKQVASLHTQTNQSVSVLNQAEQEFNMGIQYSASNQYNDAISQYRLASHDADESMQLLQ